jgi:hypothetical protein
MASEKLTSKQWSKIKERLDAGESANSIAKDFKIHRSQITRRFSQHNKVVKELANQIVSVEQNLRAATKAQQIDALDLAGTLLSISNHVGHGARYGAMTFHRLAGIANQQAQLLDDDNPDAEDLLNIARLTDVGNKAAIPAFNLLAANKGKDQADDTSKDAFLERVTGKVVGVTHDPD